jgi:hypothetical protein
MSERNDRANLNDVIASYTLKLREIGSSKTMVNTNNIAQCKNPEIQCLNPSVT